MCVMSVSPNRTRPRLTTTIARDVKEALDERAAALQLPLGRVVDAALRAGLGLPDPLAPRLVPKVERTPRDRAPRVSPMRAVLAAFEATPDAPKSIQQLVAETGLPGPRVTGGLSALINREQVRRRGQGSPSVFELIPDRPPLEDLGPDAAEMDEALERGLAILEEERGRG